MWVALVLTLLVWVVYAITATTASERKSAMLPWQWTHSWDYDPAHNVWDGYVAQARFSNTWTSDAAVYDSVTKLVWQKDGGTQKNWSGAIGYCEDLDLWWWEDWRLPTYKELTTIVDLTRTSPSIDETFFSAASNRYWSSSPYANITSRAWGVNFNYGDSNRNTKTSGSYVRCVR
jgi:hypothetical protein